MKKYGLIGFPLEHSFSRSFFTAKFKEEGLDCIYENYPLHSITDFPALIFSEAELYGLNVTLPYKKDIIQYLDEVHYLASKIGAVNTIKIERKGSGVRMVGYNTDVHGFIESLKPLLSKDIKKALILGTGGASLAVASGFQTLGIDYIFVSRDKQRGDLTYDELNRDLFSEYSLIINTTPLGMYPNTGNAPNIPYDELSPSNILFDLVYNPELTLFMKKSRKMGCRVSNGLEMLHNQAMKSWEIWNGVWL